MREIRLHAGIPVKPVYGPEEVAGDTERQIGRPGEYPFTRGIHPEMYRDRLWTMRQYVGFGTPAETNARFKYLMAHGQDALNVAFDLPTQLGLDSDDPRAEGEVGRVGMAVDTLADMEEAFAGIPLDRVSVSLTINSMAAPITAMYYVVAEQQGVAAGPHRDHAPERHPQGVRRARDVGVPGGAVAPARGRPHRVLGTSATRARTRSRSAAITSARPAAPPPRRWRTGWPSPPPTSS